MKARRVLRRAADVAVFKNGTEGRADCAGLYRRKRHEFADLVQGLTRDELDRNVPATPAWSIGDVLAHVVGIVVDLNAQRFPEPSDAGGAAWTDAQVARAHGREVEDLVAEWERESPTFEQGLAAFGYRFGSHYVADLHAHCQDVRQALALPADRDEVAVRVALDHYLSHYDEVLRAIPDMRVEVVAGGERHVLGAGRLRATAHAEPFELLPRALSGRRSERQIRALDWSGDVDGVLRLLHRIGSRTYSIRTTDLVDE